MNELSVKECLSVGWKTFTSRPWLFIGAGAVILFISVIGDIPRALTKNIHGIEGILIAGVTFIISSGISFLVSMGKANFYLKSHDSVENTKITDLWRPQPFLKYAGASILTGAATILGLILFIVPGIILGIVFGFSQYIVLEKELSPVAALRESALRTKGNRWNLFLLGLALLGINILGACALLVGLIVTIPISTIAVIHAYRTLTKEMALVVQEPVST